MVKRILIFIFFLLSSFVLLAQNEAGHIKFLFIGHCYQINTAGNKVDYRIEKLDKSPYAGIWLGGDVCSEAMLEYATMDYINSLFDLGNPDTHWALGNHDARNGNWEWYTEFTHRKTYYAYCHDGITRIVMNTNLVPTECEKLDEQYAIIQNVCDTIKKSKYLVLLMHHGIWRDVPGLPPPATYAQSDLRYWNSNCYDVNSTFVKTIYPRLVEVRKRGIQVICILGDMGAGQNKFDMYSDDSIHFLGCGLYHNEPDDVVLVFDYDTQQQGLTYGFYNLDSLLNLQR